MNPFGRNYNIKKNQKPFFQWKRPDFMDQFEKAPAEIMHNHHKITHPNFTKVPISKYHSSQQITPTLYVTGETFNCCLLYRIGSMQPFLVRNGMNSSTKTILFITLSKNHSEVMKPKICI